MLNETATHGGAGNSPDAVRCIVAQIGQSSSGSLFGVCCWVAAVDLLAATRPIEALAAALGAINSSTCTWPKDTNSWSKRAKSPSPAVPIRLIRHPRIGILWAPRPCGRNMCTNIEWYFRNRHTGSSNSDAWTQDAESDRRAQHPLDSADRGSPYGERKAASIAAGNHVDGRIVAQLGHCSAMGLPRGGGGLRAIRIGWHCSLARTGPRPRTERGLADRQSQRLACYRLLSGRPIPRSRRGRTTRGDR
jgi:hypothetical protein